MQGVFTVDSDGVRRVVGLHDYGIWDPTACGKDDEYIGQFRIDHGITGVTFLCVGP